MTDAIQKAREALRGQLTLLHSLANDTTEANWRDKRLYILQTCVRMSDALAALDAETEVKALKWKRRKGGHAGDEYADTIVGQYAVGDIHGRVKALLRRIDGNDTADEELWSGQAFASAKAAAQADYERRIRSALVPPEARS